MRVLIIIAIVGCFSLQVQASPQTDGRGAYNLGNKYYRKGDFENAKNAYLKAGELLSPEHLSKLYYNLGNTMTKLSDKKSAITYYTNALILDPTDKEAKHNLEVSLKEDDSDDKDNDQDQNQDDQKKKDAENALNRLDDLERQARDAFLNQEQENKKEVEVDQDW